MKIDPTAPQRPTPLRRAGSSAPARGDGFAKVLADAGPAASMSGASPLGPLSSVLSLQEVPDALDRRTRARRRGEQLLDELERIRLALLAGALSAHQLNNLAQMVRARRESVDDPRLAEILDEIELRAAVELAKYSQLG